MKIMEISILLYFTFELLNSFLLMANLGWRVTFVPWSHGNTSVLHTIT